MYAVLYMCIAIGHGSSCLEIRTYNNIEECIKVRDANLELVKTKEKFEEETYLTRADFFCVYK